jgi:hypothetical protein
MFLAFCRTIVGFVKFLVVVSASFWGLVCTAITTILRSGESWLRFVYRKSKSVIDILTTGSRIFLAVCRNIVGFVKFLVAGLVTLWGLVCTAISAILRFGKSWLRFVYLKSKSGIDILTIGSQAVYAFGRTIVGFVKFLVVVSASFWGLVCNAIAAILRSGKSWLCLIYRKSKSVIDILTIGSQAVYASGRNIIGFVKFVVAGLASILVLAFRMLTTIFVGLVSWLSIFTQSCNQIYASKSDDRLPDPLFVWPQSRWFCLVFHCRIGIVFGAGVPIKHRDID